MSSPRRARRSRLWRTIRWLSSTTSPSFAASWQRFTSTGPIATDVRDGSREDLANHVPGDVSQPEVPARVTVRQLLMVESHQGQQGGVQVRRVHAALDGVRSELVGAAVGEALL